MKRLIIPVLMLLCSCGDDKPKTETNDTAPPPPPSTPVISYSVVKSIPHDTNLFTEGLFVHEGKLYESTGSPEDLPQARSLVGIIDMATGKMDIKKELDRKHYFGEGIAMLNGKIYQLTYKGQTGFIYDAKTFAEVGKFSFPSAEGWGMTTDGTNLIMSDGTEKLTYLDPATLKPVKTITVTEHGVVLPLLNELEYINGALYANIFTTNDIVRIDPANGNVTGRLDLNSLAYQAGNKNANSLEMNGIAYDAANGSIYITGKFWPFIFQVDFKH